MPSPRQIVAMAGGGFSMEPRNPRLDRYVLGLVRRPRPKVCFLGAASGDAANYVLRFHAAFKRLRCRTSHLGLFPPPTADIRSYLLQNDVLYVGGGNTKSMLALWRDWGIPEILTEAGNQGIVLAGVSAGALCWFKEGVTDSIPGTFSFLPGLGFLPESFCPHYDSEPGRRPAYHRMLAEGKIAPGYAGDDGVAFHYVGDRLEKIVSSRPRAMAYRLDRDGTTATEGEVVPEFLA